MSNNNAEPADTKRAHHPDCPVSYFTGHPERCRCMFMAMLDRAKPRTPPGAPMSGGDQ